jgi:branched-chain amino acid transport system permease protein
LAGSIISPLYAINPAIGVPYTIKALCITVMGGLGSIKGVMAAALVLGLSESFGSLFIGTGLKDAIGYLFLLLTLLLRPQGLFRR